MLRVIHTADWHLGQTLLTFSREYEHRQFLEWLAKQVVEREADALLIAGDIFDTANPSNEATAMLYKFVAEVKRARPKLDVVIIAGNHDSPGRLEAPIPLFEAIEVAVIGAVERRGGVLRTDNLVVPLHDAAGAIAGWCAAIPFLRVCDLEPVAETEGADPLIEGTRATVGKIVAAARARCEAGQALIALGHCYMVGTQISELSERKILGGNQHALPGDLFPAEVAYAALGHLHLAQRVGAGERLRYSGSPFPLSLSEIDYPHQIVALEFDGERLVKSEEIRVPRPVEMKRVPDEPRPIAEVVPLLKALPPGEKGNEHLHAYLEVQVRIDAPDSTVRRQVEEAIAGRAVRLAKLSVTRPAPGTDAGERSPEERLADITPEKVFRELYACEFAARGPAGKAASGGAPGNGEEPAPVGGDPSPELLAAFHELVETVNRRDDDQVTGGKA